jgi:sigma-B regulation protein RsbU (phosphoserine phosphatase)
VHAIAGHPAPRLIEPGGSVTGLEGAAAPPIGIYEELEVPEQSVQLRPEQGLVLYTDGITEAFDQSRAMLGIEGLDRAIAAAAPPRDPDAVIDAIHAAVYRHTGTRARADDQTVVAMRVE